MTEPTTALSIPTTSPEWEQTKRTLATYELPITEVTNDAEYTQAGAALVAIAGMRKDLDAKRKLITGPLDEAKKAVMAQVREADAPLAQAENQLRLMGRGYRQEQERKATEAQAELNRQAQAAAEQEALERAEALEKAGRKEEAEAALEPAIIQQAAQQRTMHVSSTPPKAAGIAVTKIWKAKVVNRDMVPREWWVIDESALGRHARNLKEQAVVPGVEFYPEDSERVSR